MVNAQKDIYRGQIQIDYDLKGLNIVGAGTAAGGRRVYIDSSVTIRDNLTVRGICDCDRLSAKSIGPNLVVQHTTRGEIDASPKFNICQPMITETASTSAGMISTKDDYIWHLHAPNNAIRVAAKGIHLGNQLDKGYERASGSITASEYEVDTLCIVGIGAAGNHMITCWAAICFKVDGSVTANDDLNSSDKQ